VAPRVQTHQEASSPSVNLPAVHARLDRMRSPLCQTWPAFLILAAYVIGVAMFEEARKWLTAQAHGQHLIVAIPDITFHNFSGDDQRNFTILFARFNSYRSVVVVREAV
jgi:hypothetical protein